MESDQDTALAPLLTRIRRNGGAEQAEAEKAMSLSKATDVNIVKGWFKDSLPSFLKEEKIALLRLDGDWYESIMDCMELLYPNVVTGGLIIIDDYYTWDGCSRAIHDYLSKNQLADRG